MKDEQKALMELHKNLQKGLSWEDLFLQPNMTNETLQQLLDCGLIEYRGHMERLG